MDASSTELPRHLTSALNEALSDTPVVCILGPRQCGKSTLAEIQSPERKYYSLDDLNLLRTAKKDPAGFIAQLPGFVTIDEVQRVPELFLAIKRSVDTDRRSGRFLLTGSANLLQMPRLADSLAGRMECIYLHPFTASEKAQTTGQFLERWLDGAIVPELQSSTPPTPSTLAERLLAGGYPEPNRRTPKRARQWHRQYIQSIIERDIHDVADVKEAQDVARLLEQLAHQSGQLLNVSNLSKSSKLDRETVERYLAILEKLFLIRRTCAWHRNSAKRLIKATKIHLRDSGLIATLTGLKASDWNSKRERFGHVLESYIMQELVAQGGWTDPDLRFWHYRDKDKVEVDCVITLGNKVWGVEIKASATVSPSDGKGLRRLAAQTGADFQGGIVFYDGDSTFPLGADNLLAMPISKLWTL